MCLIMSSLLVLMFQVLGMGLVFRRGVMGIYVV